MLAVNNIRYVRLGVADLDAASNFATRVAGLQEVGRLGTTPGSRAAYFRSDSRHHALVYSESRDEPQAVGFETTDAPALKAEARRLDALGLSPRIGTRDECALRNVSAMLKLSDPSGNQIEIVVPQRDTDAPFVPPRPAGIEGLAHVGLRSSDPARDEAFWTDVLGARVSDRVGIAPMLRFDVVHHRVALLQSIKPGIHHVAFQVGTFDDVMRNWYFLKDSGVRVVFGPGREPTSSAIFVYFEGPGGVLFEYSAGAKTIPADTNPRPRHFPNAPRSFCMWGGKPDSNDFNL
jgi:2,3-dihydroxy-p-cumate/2,3-dihydroxybenzoate 3,4-dioxygenase